MFTGRHIMRRVVAGAVMMLLLILGVLPVSATQTAGQEDAFFALPEEYGEMLSSLPDAIHDSLPEDLFAVDPAQQEEALEHFLTPAACMGYLAELLLGDVSVPLSLLVSVCGVLLLRAVMDNISAGLGGGVSSAFSLLCRLCFCIVLVQQTFGVVESVRAYFEALRQLTGAYLPLMGAMYLAGGNVAVATVNQGTLVFATSLVDVLGGESVVPMFAICLALTLVGMLDSGVGARMAHIGGKIKKWYTTALALTMLLLGAVLAARTTLAARADSLGFKTVRFVVSSNIPFVGGGVAEMLRSAASGVSWLRSLVGVGGVVMLLALLLPTVGQVLFSRWVCMLGADAAAWFGCGEEGRLLSEIGSLYGYLLAVVSLSCMTFFFSLILLLQCAAAF